MKTQYFDGKLVVPSIKTKAAFELEGGAWIHVFVVTQLKIDIYSRLHQCLKYRINWQLKVVFGLLTIHCCRRTRFGHQISTFDANFEYC